MCFKMKWPKLYNWESGVSVIRFLGGAYGETEDCASSCPVVIQPGGSSLVPAFSCHLEFRSEESGQFSEWEAWVAREPS